MNKGLLGIDIGSNSIRYVYLEKTNGDYCVVKAGKSAVEVDLSASGPLFDSINKILDDEQISPERIFVTLSKANMLIHQVTLPKMTTREYEEVIFGEIEKAPQFIKTDFEYIHKGYPQKREKNRVIYVGITKHELLTLVNEVQKTEIPFDHLEISPLNLKELSALINGKEKTESFLMVHDKHGYLAIYESGEYKLLYKFSSGLEDLNGEKSEEERQALVGHWVAEIKRVLKSYELENRNRGVKTLNLVWDREQYPALEQLMNDELDIEVKAMSLTHINKIRTLENYPINPIYALALTPIACLLNQVRTDFPHQHFFRGVKVKEYTKKTAIGVCAVAVAVGVVCGIFGFGFARRADTLNKRVVKLNTEIVGLRKEAKGLYSLQQEHRQSRKRLLDQASYVQQLNRVSWSEVLAIVSNELPGDLALTDFKFSESGRATIKGSAYQMESIAELIRRTDDSERLERGKFDFLKEKSLDDEKYYQFGIFANLKKYEKPDEIDTKQN